MIYYRQPSWIWRRDNPRFVATNFYLKVRSRVPIATHVPRTFVPLRKFMTVLNRCKCNLLPFICYIHYFSYFYTVHVNEMAQLGLPLLPAKLIKYKYNLYLL